MKLPRWLVIAMLTTSVLSVLAAAGWWWVTWPERTAREFLDMMAAKKLHEVNEITYWSSDSEYGSYTIIGSDDPWKQSSLHPQGRTIFDLMLGAQCFMTGPSDIILFNVKRGKVVAGPLLWFNPEAPAVRGHLLKVQPAAGSPAAAAVRVENEQGE